MIWEIGPDQFAEDEAKLYTLPVVELKVIRRHLQNQLMMMGSNDGLERMIHQMDSIIQQKSRPN